MRDAVTIVLAVFAGMALASFDMRTDDTGIEVGLLVIASVGLAFVAPKRWWAIALLVGGFIPLVELGLSQAAGSRVPPGVGALAITLVGALIGFGITRASRSSSPA